jgi:hypothetical protein
LHTAPQNNLAGRIKPDDAASAIARPMPRLPPVTMTRDREIQSAADKQVSI